MKSLYLIILTLLIAVTVVVLLALIVIRTSSPREEVVEIPLPTESPIRFEAPEGEKIDISGIPVNNPYIAPIQISVYGDSFMERGSGYDLVYLKDYGEFLITVTASPFETNRQAGEQALLSRLGVTEEQACLLNVKVGTPQNVNPNEAGRSFELSFCE